MVRIDIDMRGSRTRAAAAGRLRHPPCDVGSSSFPRAARGADDCGRRL
jgi:hypothetical protein